MRADVGTVPVQFMRKENCERFVFCEQVRNDFYGGCPMLRLIRARFRIDGFQSVRSGFFQAKAEPVAGIFQFLPAPGMPFFFAAESYCHINDAKRDSRCNRSARPPMMHSSSG